MANTPSIRREPNLSRESRIGAVMNDIEEELQSMVNGTNLPATTNIQAPPEVPREITKPEGLGMEIAKAMEEAAEAALVEAQNHLQKTKIDAEKIREDVKAWADKHDALVKRFQDLGKSTLESYRKYTEDLSF
jgi:hypothetical protein